MLKDRYGNELSTSSPAAADAYNTGLDRLLSASPATDAAFRAAISADDGFALAHIALARTLQIQGQGSDAKEPLARAKALAGGTTAREQSHIALFAMILDGQGASALAAIREHVKTWPGDAMALAPATSVFGLIGFSGKVGREVDQLALLEPLVPHYGDDWWFQMVLAFAEIELGYLDRGRRNIERSLATFPRNAHGAHINAHLHYEAGERAAGLSYLSDFAKDYPRDAQLHCHMHWHLALWNLETRRPDDAWRVYETSLRPGAAWGPPINVLTDCASFLFRAELAGESRSPVRWRELSDFAAKWFPNSGVAFADVHSALAFAMAGDGEALSRIAEQPKGVAADIVAPIAKGFSAFARGDWDAAIKSMQPLLATHERVGGSRAQRDLLEYAVVGALLRAGRGDDARHLISARRPQNAGAHGFPVAGLAAGHV